MTDFRMIELMAGIDEQLLARANAPIPVYRKRKFKIAMMAVAAALLMLILIVAAPLAIVIPYANAHPEIEGGLIYVADAMLEDDEHFLSKALPKSVRSSLGAVFDALTGGDGGEPSDQEPSTEPPVQDTSEPPIQETTQDTTEQTTQDATEPTTEESTEPSTDHAHVSVTDEAVAPTCQSTGLSEGAQCKVCL